MTTLDVANFLVYSSYKYVFSVQTGLYNSGALSDFDKISSNKFIACNLSAPTIEIPAFARNVLEHATVYGFHNFDSVLVHPIYIGSMILGRESFKDLLLVFKDSTCPLSKVKIKDTYITGGRGIIIDDQGRVLLLLTLAATHKEDALVYTESRAYIHPCVFNSTNFIHKSIVKYMIPALTSHGVVSPVSLSSLTNVRVISEIISPVKVMIEDKSDIILSDSTAHSVSTFNRVNNNILNEHIDEIKEILTR